MNREKSNCPCDENGCAIDIDALDLDLLNRKASIADMGVNASIGDEVNCLGDLTSDGIVGVPDLLAVINAWGPCAAPCVADFMPGPQVCGGADGVVGVPDMLGIINNWGPCPTSGPGGGGGVPTSISDCWNVYCSGLSGEEWQNRMDKCIESVCQEYPEECD